MIGRFLFAGRARDDVALVISHDSVSRVTFGFVERGSLNHQSYRSKRWRDSVLLAAEFERR